MGKKGKPLDAVSTLPMRMNLVSSMMKEAQYGLLILDGGVCVVISRSHGHGNTLAPAGLLESVKIVS